MSKINPIQITDAVRALYAYLAKKKAENADKLALWEDDQDISLLFALSKTPEKERAKPFRIPLKHSLYHRPGVEICLFTADPQSQYKEFFTKNPIENVTKVIGIGKLRRQFIPYKDKRTLLNSFTVFMADRRITNLLPPLLSGKFFSKKKQPIPVKLTLTDANLVKEITKARDSTYLFINTGPCCAVRIGRSSFTQQEVVENILAVIDPIVKNFPKKWSGLQAIYLKTPDSVSLPLYNSLPEINQKISLSIKPDTEEAKKGNKKNNKKRKQTTDEAEEQQQQFALKESDRKENKRTKFKLKKIGRKQKKAQQQTNEGGANTSSQQKQKKKKGEDEQTQKTKKAKSISTLLREVANGE